MGWRRWDWNRKSTWNGGDGTAEGGGHGMQGMGLEKKEDMRWRR